MKKLILDSCHSCPHCRDDLPDEPYCEESGIGIPAIVKQTGPGAFTTELIEEFPDWCLLPDEQGKSERSCGVEEKSVELPGKKYLIKLSGEEVYVVISYNEGMPWEVFATVPCSWLPSDPRKGYMGAINRLAALSLQSGTGVEKVVSQLTKSSAGDGDYSGILAGLLERGGGDDE